MAKELVESLTELEKAEVADEVLPGILEYLDKLLSREHISQELEEVRQRYVAILQCTSTESPEVVRKNVATLAESLSLKYEAGSKSGKFGRIREKRLINIRQFHFKQNSRKHERKNKMDLNDESRLLSHTDDESRLIPRLSKRKSKATTDSENTDQVNGQVNLATDDESRYPTTTDDERRVSMSGESFVELSESQRDLASQKLSKSTDSNFNKGYLYHKENDGLRQRWFVLEESVLKCYKRQNQSLLFEINFTECDYSAIQGRIGKMFAIRLSGSKPSSSHLFASPKVDIIASWMMALGRAGVRLQDDILREVSMNQQNNNKVKWSLDDKDLPEKDELRSELLEALEFIERSRSPCILPKRSSYSFKELDVLKKLKSSLVAKKAEGKLSRRKTWSAGSFPIANLAILDKLRKPISGSDVNVIDERKENDKIVKELASKSLPEILTISGVVPIVKEEKNELESCADNVDQVVGSEEEISYSKSLPEGLNKETESHVIKDRQSPRGSITAQSVPDLLIHPAQESLHDSSSPKRERQMKPSISLTRAMSLKASLMKNAIIGGWKRKGRRGSGVMTLDLELSDIHGCLFRKKGAHWKLRWCAVGQEIFYAFRDSQYSQEDFRCSLKKCLVLSNVLAPGRAFSFKLTRRRGEEILLAAEDESEFERWLTVLQRETAKCQLPLSDDSRSSSLTLSLFGSDTVCDSSATEDTPPEIRNSNYCETTDKDSSDEHSTTSSVSTKVRSRGLHEKGYVYYLIRKDTWEHCWMEVSFGVLSIYKNETKENALQRDHVALCDIQHDSTNEQRSFSFVLKKPGRHPIYFAVDSEHDFLKWRKCFSSWRKRASPDDTRENGHPALKGEDVVTSNQNYLTIPRSSPPVQTPATSDSDCCGEGQDSKISELADRPKIRRSMTDVLSQITPKLKRRSHSSIGSVDAGNETRKNAAKSSYLYYKANSGLWVKYWCVLDSVVIYCYKSPEDGVANFSVEIQGCEIRRTSCKSKNFTFGVFNRTADKTYEFAGESAYVMYAWMRVLKTAVGFEVKNMNSTSDEISAPKSEEPGTGNEPPDAKTTGENLDDEIFENKDGDREKPPSPRESTTTSRTSLSAPVSPKRKQKITSLDEVMKLLHEKRLEQELLTKELTNSERARKRWQHAMLVVLRKTRSMRTHSSSENLKSSGSFGSDSGASPELDEKTVKVKYREITAKYDDILEDERLKMLRRETLLKKRRNSLILRQDILQKKLNNGGKGTLKKRQSKSDAKEMSTAFTKGETQEVVKQLADISKELEGIKQDIATNHEDQRRISVDLNEQKHKELQEIRISLDISPQTSKSSVYDGKSLHRRQASDSLLCENYRKMTISDNTLKLPLTHTMSTPTADLRAKAKSFSSSTLPKTASNPLLRAKTYDSADGLKRPKAKTRASQEALSLALSQIEDFEAFAQDSFRNCGADVGC